jgi:hypothetical protein
MEEGRSTWAPKAATVGLRYQREKAQKTISPPAVNHGQATNDAKCLVTNETNPFGSFPALFRAS